MLPLLLFAACSREPAVKFPLERTQARLERGSYLVNDVIGCFYCHSEQDWEGPNASLPKAGMTGGQPRRSRDDVPAGIRCAEVGETT